MFKSVVVLIIRQFLCNIQLLWSWCEVSGLGWQSDKQRFMRRHFNSGLSSEYLSQAFLDASASLSTLSPLVNTLLCFNPQFLISQVIQIFCLTKICFLISKISNHASNSNIWTCYKEDNNEKWCVKTDTSLPHINTSFNRCSQTQLNLWVESFQS